MPLVYCILMKNVDWILIIALGFLWGSSFMFVEVLLQYLDPIFIVFLRVSFASVSMLLFIFVSQNSQRLSFKDIFNILIMSLLNNVFPFTFIALGQQTVTGGLASIINASTAFTSVIVASFFFQTEKLTSTRVLGVIIAIFGVASAIGFKNVFITYESNTGAGLIFLATIFYSFAAVWGKLKLNNLSPIIAATGMLLASSIILLPIILIFRFKQFLLLTPSISLYAILFALISSVLAYLLYFLILKRTGPGNLLLSTLIIVPFSLLLNKVVMNEIILGQEVVGLLIVSCGLLIIDGRAITFLKKILRKNI